MDIKAISFKDFLKNKNDIYKNINVVAKRARQIIDSRYEKVILIVNPEDLNNAQEQCSDFADMWSIPTDMSWIRDNGPIFIRNNNNEIAAVHFRFNGYGNKFIPYEKVKNIPRLIAKKLNIQCFTSNLIVEGGGVSFDGEATVITTEQMLMNVNRNANFTKKQIEMELYNTLGIEKVIWLKKGLVEDKDTDGHVDCVVEYIAPGKIIAQTVHEKNNPNYELLKDNLKALNEEDIDVPIILGGAALTPKFVNEIILSVLSIEKFSVAVINS